MDPDIDLVTLLGPAGTGKSLLAIASALAQIFDTDLYSELLITRSPVPIGEDIGFLPGTEEEKMTPWMGALMDNLVLTDKSDDEISQAGIEILKRRIKIPSITFIRGRTLVNKFFVIDEAQNLTVQQMETLITRAGYGTKIVCLGNIAQIDAPYLTEATCGLTYVVEKFKNWKHSGFITLTQGERSRLASKAVEVFS